MSTQSEQILQSALSLPEAERAEIAVALIHSLDTQVDDAVDEAWAMEIERRIATIDKGEVALIPFDDVLAEMRRRAHG